MSYVRYQMSKLFSLVLLFLVASVFDINDGVALTPLMVLFQNFFITLFPVAVIMLDPLPADLMRKPPAIRMPIAHRKAFIQWLTYGVLQFAVTFAAMLAAPGPMSPTVANVPMTTAFVVLSFGSVLSALAMRRDPESGFAAPVLGALKILSVPMMPRCSRSSSASSRICS